MAITTYTELPTTLVLNGNEILAGYVPNGLQPPLNPYTTQQFTTQQVANLAMAGANANTVTMRQLLAALANQNLLYVAFQALPSDPANSYNIAWWHATRMSLADPFITGYLEPTIGYNSTQMAALFILALTFPA